VSHSADIPPNTCLGAPRLGFDRIARRVSNLTIVSCIFPVQELVAWACISTHKTVLFAEGVPSCGEEPFYGVARATIVHAIDCRRGLIGYRGLSFVFVEDNGREGSDDAETKVEFRKC
jgi:hypothetical protein